MLKNYWNNEIARWNRHPYIYTTITVVFVGWTLYDMIQIHKDEDTLVEKLTYV